MSLLAQTNNVAPSRSEVKAARLKKAPAELFNAMLTGWSVHMQALWKDPNPQKILDEIGTDGIELMVLSQKAVTFLESVKPGCTASVMALMPPFTVNPDGTVTINP